jgi:two-component system, OmpR family, sensor histidine kinase KdpD
VHVTRDDGLGADDRRALEAQRALLASLGGSLQQIPGDDVAEALLQFARAQNATQMVLGASSRSRLTTLVAGKSTPTRLARRAAHIDVHLVSRSGAGGRRPATGELLGASGWHHTEGKRAAADAAALSRLAVSVLSGLRAALVRHRERGRPPPGQPRRRGLSSGHRHLHAGRPRALTQRRAGVDAGLLRRPHGGGPDPAAPGRARRPHRRASGGLAVPFGMLAATGQQAREQLDAAETGLAVLSDPNAVITADGRAALAADARRAVAHVTGLLDDLRDLRRVHAGALETYLRPIDLDEILAATLEDLGPGGPDIALRVPEDLPEVIADAVLLTRILTSLTAEALRRSPAGAPPALSAGSRADHVEIRIADHGVPEGEPESLGFGLARDLTEAMGDTLRCAENEDGGRTVIVTLPAAASVSAARR